MDSGEFYVYGGELRDKILFRKKALLYRIENTRQMNSRGRTTV